jgi:isoleucyl-tRNA synthetase
MSRQTQDKSYKATLNLPKTALAMKANLVQNEPASLKRWTQAKLYEQTRSRAHPRGRYVFHDGPPYANGSIHLGHLLNKALKDFVVRARTMAGFDCPYTPGWDCHGLPIEHKVMQDLGEKALDMNAMQIRHRCRKAAQKYIDLQRQQMQRLLTLADYERPYLTMDPAYEAAVLEVFADLVAAGLVYRDLKPVHWSIDNRTALADAELEYFDRTDTSVYVCFDVADTQTLPESWRSAASDGASLMIWTTTPWTLPANLAVAVAPRSTYGLYKIAHRGSTRCVVLACALAEKVVAAGGGTDAQLLGECTGEQLVAEGLTYRHPFMDRRSIVVTADHVTLEDGTGLVHTAPGHGAEDYHTGKAHGLDIYCPVQGDGTFDDTAPQWLRGRTIWDANPLVVERLRESGHLFFDHEFVHSYPHDWRGKTPVIFRATEQWFVAVDRPVGSSGRSLVRMALDATDKEIRFLPQWGQNRMRGMLESRPDWCLSRQRAWGLPIPAFYDEQGRTLLTAASVRAVAEVIAREGSDVWFTAEPHELLADYKLGEDSDAPAWLRDDAAALGADGSRLRKSNDIFDVWFESGSSWHAALRRMQSDFPADLYLEGSDQHRGWFQVSLLPALGVEGCSPFKTVFTHGFMVDKDGRKMSKSLGNTLEVQELLKQFGADVCRWWVSSLNTDNDIKVDHEFFKLAGEEYRKVRNTIRYLLSNLQGFDPDAHAHAFTDEDAASIDAWALGALAKLIRGAAEDYDAFAFRRVHEALFNFCNQTMSAVYLAAAKDRLYCDAADGPRRRRTQTAMHLIADGLIRLIAPIVPHTADEAWAALCGTEAPSVHLSLLPEPPAVPCSPDWEQVITLRDQWLKELETFRQQHEIDNPLDLGLRLGAAGSALKSFDPVDLADLCGISRVVLEDGPSAVEVLDLRDEPRCERSWKRDGTVRQRGDGGLLSDRDAAALGV